MRAVNLSLRAEIAPGAEPHELRRHAMPLEGPTLTGMHVDTGGCTP
jgi:hypothetical protein